MDNSQAVQITINTPGWGVIRNLLENRIEGARLAALINTDESKVLELWRRAQVANQLFRSFLEDVENL